MGSKHTPIMSSEKQPLALPSWSESGASLPVERSSCKKWKWVAPALLGAWLLSRAMPLDLLGDSALDFAALEKHGASCPMQPKPLAPKMAFAPESDYRAYSAKLLSEAVVSKG